MAIIEKRRATILEGEESPKLTETWPKRRTTIHHSRTALPNAAGRPSAPRRHSTTDVHLDDELAAPAILKPEVIEECAKMAEAHGTVLPQDPSEERLRRNRIPACSVDLMLRRGAPVEDAADQTALRLIERWARMLHNKVGVPAYQLAPTIVELVRGGKMDLPPEPLQSGLFRLVPEEPQMQWPFVKELVDIFKLEEQFDPSSFVHSRPFAKGASKLAVMCGRPPPVWEYGPPKPTFAVHHFGEDRDRDNPMAPGQRKQALIRMPRSSSVPGPGTYSGRISEGMITPGRAEFASVGRPRCQCLVSLLQTQPRVPTVPKS